MGETAYLGPGILSVGLFLVGAALVGVEFFIPGGVAGIIGSSLIVGAICGLIFPEHYWVAFFIGFAVTGVVSTLTLITVYKRFTPGKSQEVMASGRIVGQEGVVLEAVAPNSMSGKVRVGGDTWTAQSEEELAPGTEVVVLRIEGVRAIVARKVG